MDDTAVVNQTLLAIGTRSSIASLSEGSPEANAAQLVYATTRDELLRRYTWGMAEKQVALAVYKAAAGTPENPNGASAQPPIPWRYSYAWPGPKCLKARFIVPVLAVPATTGLPLTTAGGTSPITLLSRKPVPFKIAADTDAASGADVKVILTDQYQAQLVFTAQITDPNLWDSLFLTAMIGRLAGKLSIALTGDKQLTKMAIEAGREAEAQAESADGQEGVFTTEHTPDWIAARQGFDDDAANWI